MNMNYFQKFLIWVSPLAQRPPALLEAVNEAKRTWLQALKDFNYITERDLVDFSIHNIKASERRYMALIRRAREEGVSAWPGEICSYEPSKAETEKQKALAG